MLTLLPHPTTNTPIVLAPPSTTLSRGEADYALTTCTITQPGPLTLAQDYHHILLPISGAGVVLNGHPYATFEIAHCPAGSQIQCELQKKGVTGLILAYHPARIRANARVLTLPFPLTLTLAPEHTYLVTLLEGSLTAGTISLSQGQSLQITGEEQLPLQCDKRATLAFFTLQKAD